MSEQEDPQKAAYADAKQAFDELSLSEQLTFLGREGLEVVIEAVGCAARAVSDEVDSILNRSNAKTESDDG